MSVPASVSRGIARNQLPVSQREEPVTSDCAIKSNIQVCEILGLFRRAYGRATKAAEHRAKSEEHKGKSAKHTAQSAEHMAQSAKHMAQSAKHMAKSSEAFKNAKQSAAEAEIAKSEAAKHRALRDLSKEKLDEQNLKNATLAQSIAQHRTALRDEQENLRNIQARKADLRAQYEALTAAIAAKNKSSIADQ